MNVNEHASNGETIYGTHRTHDEHAMSEKVQNLAASLYKEFEQMMAKYDEDVVKSLMPLIVNILECLDSAYHNNQEHEVELELLREDNEQLVTQYEREKAARKHAEQKLLEAEDLYDGDKKELTERLEALDSIVKMLELKHKNSLDHASRLEERENELKKEYAKLHDRYTAMFKSHMDYMEKTKLLLSSNNDRSEMRGRLGLNPVGRSSGPISFGFASLEGSVHVIDTSDSMPGSPTSVSSSPPSPTIGSELAAAGTMERSHQTDPLKLTSQATSPLLPSGRSQTRSEKRSGNTLYQELAFTETENAVNEPEEGPDFTGSWVHPGDYASSVNDNYFGMGKEVENLIMENNELLATKNALNIVKDDLIVKVDELTGEQEMLREEISNLSGSRERLKDRVTQLEDELRQLKETINNTVATEAEDEADVPMAQRKRFTRVEMARVLMERNQYKERFMELQDAVRWTEMVRANRVDAIDKKNKSIWTLFSNLFSSGERPQRPLSTPHLRAVAAPQPTMRHSRTQADFLESQLSAEHQQRRRERNDQFRQVRAHVRKEDGRTQAYGWSLPSKTSQTTKGPNPYSSLATGGIPVPVPVFCRPIVESEPRMTLSCAAGVNLEGGYTADGGIVFRGSIYYAEVENTAEAPLSLADEMNKAIHANSPKDELTNRQLRSTQLVNPEKNTLSSLVWICANTQMRSVVMVTDANNPADTIATFPVNDKHILCIASVPGATPEDYKEYEERMAKTLEEEKTSHSIPQNRSTEAIDGSDTTFPSLNDSTDFLIGSSKLVRSTLMSPVASPVQDTEPAPKASPELKEDSNGSPPNVFTPEKVPHNEPEPALDAFAQEQTYEKKRKDLLDDCKISTIESTMWFGTKNGNLYVHSAVDHYTKCLAAIKLHDAILSIVPCASRCVVALADGTVAIFARLADGNWDFSTYWSVALGDPKCSVRCLSAVGSTVWCGYRNRVHVLEPRSRTILHSLEAHPRQESQVRQMAWQGDGVWISIKMDSTLRLYHAQTYEHLKDVDIEPYVSKMLGTGKLGFSLVRITALMISTGRLWIGTSNGVVISVPLSECAGRELGPLPPLPRRIDLPGPLTVLRERPATPTGNIPFCSMAHAQLSFHGHRDAVTFFVAVPGANSLNTVDSFDSPPPMLVISGGEGYIDFRIADSEMEDSVGVAGAIPSAVQNALTERATRSHLIVWQVSTA